ncbi:voltage-dependent anion channel [Penicillium chrysogenum]|nr:voltage-dependent anion channel [Penicillium chrysogenum]
MVIAIYLMRLMLHKLPATAVIVSTFLPLGPLGQGSYGIQKLGSVSRTVSPLAKTVLPGSEIRSMMAFSLGVWIAAVLFAAATIDDGGLLSLWVCALRALANLVVKWRRGSLQFLGNVVLLWLTVSAFTTKGIYNRSLFVAPCLTDMNNKQKERNEGQRNDGNA